MLPIPTVEGFRWESGGKPRPFLCHTGCLSQHLRSRNNHATYSRPSRLIYLPNLRLNHHPHLHRWFTFKPHLPISLVQTQTLIRPDFYAQFPYAISWETINHANGRSRPFQSMLRFCLLPGAAKADSTGS